MWLLGHVLREFCVRKCQIIFQIIPFCIPINNEWELLLTPYPGQLLVLLETDSQITILYHLLFHSLNAVSTLWFMNMLYTFIALSLTLSVLSMEVFLCPFFFTFENFLFVMQNNVYFKIFLNLGVVWLLLGLSLGSVYFGTWL